MAENEYVTVQEHNEFAKRIDQENERQNHRLSALEEHFAMVQSLAVSTEKLAVNMEVMAKELAKQGNKLNEIEMKPAKRWDLVITTVIAGVFGALVTIVMKGLL